MHGVFDIIGPVMIGPSSSHTAGAARLGLIARKILGEEVVSAEIGLHGSFARTYRGHGTDRALLAGIMGFSAEDERIKAAIDIAKEQNITHRFYSIELPNTHPNTVQISLTGKSGRISKIIGSSIGGGNIRVTNINGYAVEFTGQYPALVTVHRDCPGIITKVTSVLVKYKVNIAFMRVSRSSRGAEALMILETDDVLSEELVAECQQVFDVKEAFSIPSI